MIRVKTKLVWWSRFILKVSLLSLRIPNKIFNKFGIFRHGAMDQDSYVNKIWKIHFLDVEKDFLISRDGLFLEIGPGDSLKSAVKAFESGFNKIALIDKGMHAIDQKYIKDYFSKKNFNSDNEFLKTTTANSFNYLIDGIKSLSYLEKNSVSYVFSNSVLQHFDKNDLNYFIKNLHKVSSDHCIQSHVIDLKDMINRSHNHHECPDFIWESKFFKELLIYTNRLNTEEWIDLFTKNGFKILNIKIYDDEGKLFDLNKSSINADYKIANIHLIIEKEVKR
tara:strand:+ start:3318 stop:4154 length:837 start_codon:yes stop_codon:yes gene_type:complete